MSAPWRRWILAADGKGCLPRNTGKPADGLPRKEEVELSSQRLVCDVCSEPMPTPGFPALTVCLLTIEIIKGESIEGHPEGDEAVTTRILRLCPEHEVGCLRPVLELSRPFVP